MTVMTNSAGKLPAQRSRAGATTGPITGGADAPKKNGVADRLTKQLASDNWTPVPLSFLQNYADLGLTPTEAMFVLHVLSFKWDKRKPYPGLRGIAALMGVDYSSVRRYAKRCRELGLIGMEYRKGSTCLYNFDDLFRSLEERIAEKKSRSKSASSPAS